MEPGRVRFRLRPCDADQWTSTWRVDLHKGVDALTASAFELVDGSYREYATAPDGVLTLDRPWPLRADLRALARGRA